MSYLVEACSTHMCLIIIPRLLFLGLVARISDFGAQCSDLHVYVSARVYMYVFCHVCIYACNVARTLILVRSAAICMCMYQHVCICMCFVTCVCVC